jgi:thiol-disulfide isomerase/thioredoxin
MMLNALRVLPLLLCVLGAPLLSAQASESAIINQIRGLRSVSAVDRPAATIKIAKEIRTLPAGASKVKLANALSNLVTEGDPGMEALQAVADSLSQALAESPIPAAKGDQAPMPYMELANLVRYEHVTAKLDDPLFAKAAQTLADNEAAIADLEKANFTLKDTAGKKVTLSELHGKIILVNFWATWCPPCRLEMPDLDAIYTHFKSQGLVVLSITGEDLFKVAPFLGKANYHPIVLLDSDGKVNKKFHVEGIPRTFLFNRDGKLIDEAIDMRTQRQFLVMLSHTDLHP